MPTTRREVIYLDRKNPHFAVEYTFNDVLNIERCDAFRYLDMHTCAGSVPDPWSEVIVNYIKRTTPKPLLIADSYRYYFEGDINESEDTRKHFERYEELISIGTPVIILHIPTEGSNDLGGKGSKDQKFYVDAGYGLLNEGGAVELTSLKLELFARRIQVMKEITFKYEDGVFARTYPQGQNNNKKRGK